MNTWPSTASCDTEKRTSCEEAFSSAPFDGAETHPLISVVIPAYNAAAFLEETLASVLRQSYQYLECLVVDDGSMDATSSIARHASTADDRVRLIRQDNKGVSSARNTGLAAATGQYVLFLDSDDLMTPYALETLLSVLAQHSEAVAAAGLIEYVDTSGTETATPGIMETWGKCAVIVKGRRLLASELRHGQPIPFAAMTTRPLLTIPGAVLCRRSAAVRCGGFDPSLSHAEDWDFAVQLALQGPVIHTDSVVLHYRQWPGQATALATRFHATRQNARVRAKALRLCRVRCDLALPVASGHVAFYLSLCRHSLVEARQCAESRQIERGGGIVLRSIGQAIYAFAFLVLGLYHLARGLLESRLDPQASGRRWEQE